MRRLFYAETTDTQASWEILKGGTWLPAEWVTWTFPGQAQGCWYPTQKSRSGHQTPPFSFPVSSARFPWAHGSSCSLAVGVAYELAFFLFSVNIFLHWRLVFHRDLELKKCEDLCSAHQDKGPHLPGVRGPRLLSQLDILHHEVKPGVSRVFSSSLTVQKLRERGIPSRFLRLLYGGTLSLGVEAMFTVHVHCSGTPVLLPAPHQPKAMTLNNVLVLNSSFDPSFCVRSIVSTPTLPHASPGSDTA